MAEVYDFNQKLSEVAEKVFGTVGICLVGRDGIPLAEYRKENIDLAVAEAQFASVVSTVKTAMDDLQGGEIEEVIVAGESLTVLMRFVGPDFFLAILMKGPLVNFGLARFELKRLALEFIPQLY